MVTRRGLKVVGVVIVAMLGLWGRVGASHEAITGDDWQTKTYRTARELVDEQPARAVALARRLVDEGGHGVRDRFLELQADALLEAGRLAEAVDSYEALMDEAPGTRAAPRAAIRAAELSVLLADRERAARLAARARELVKRVLEEGPQARYIMARSLRLEHDLAVGAGELDRAGAIAEGLVVELPAEEATRRSGLRAGLEGLDRAQRVERARNLYDHWAYAQSRREFAALADDPRHGATARWYLGHIALNKLRDDPAGAEALFAALSERGPYREASLYQVARAQMRQERYEDALQTLDAYLKRYPVGRHVESVYYYRGWLPYDHRDNERAIAGFKAYIARYGRGAGRSSYVYGFLAWTYMRQQRWREAIATYEEMRPWGNTLVEGKALYWQAWAFWRLGEVVEARARLDALRRGYAVSYYGVLGEQLRARIAGEDPRASRVWWPEGGGGLDDRPVRAASDWELDGLEDAVRARWERVKALVSLGEPHLAREAVGPIRGALAEAVAPAERGAWRHALGHFVGDYHEMWEVATGNTIAAHPSPPPAGSLEAKMAYPRAYQGVVEEVAERFEIAPEWMWAVMRQESRYRPGQVSYTDAVGALQMIPKTARRVAAELGVDYDPRSFHVPRVGFPYSGYYLRRLLDTFDGHLVLASAAYNSGPEVVAYWVKQNRGAEFAWLVEEFAYNEGRNYCRKVAEHMLRYLYLYEEDARRRGRVLEQLFPVEVRVELPEDVGY